MGKERITSWEKFKKHLQKAFLPFNYYRTLYTRLQNLRQGSKSVDEYAAEFNSLLVRVHLTETEEQIISRFIGGLRQQIQNQLLQFNPFSVSEAHQRAVLIETSQLARSNSTWSGSSSRPRQFMPQETNTNKALVEATNKGPQYKQPDNNNPRAIKCFSCGEQGHRQINCPKNKALMVEAEPQDDVVEEGVADLFEEEQVEGDTGHMLVIRRNFLTPQIKAEPWLRTNIFRSTCTIRGKVCKLIIDSGSCTNVISEDAANRLALFMERHPSPYKLAWLNSKTDLSITRRCKVPFSIGQNYKDEVVCDVIPMDACHILLGRPWQFDNRTTHDGFANTYSFIFEDRKITLLPTQDSTEVSDSVPANKTMEQASSLSARSLILQ